MMQSRSLKQWGETNPCSVIRSDVGAGGAWDSGEGFAGGC